MIFSSTRSLPDSDRVSLTPWSEAIRVLPCPARWQFSLGAEATGLGLGQQHHQPEAESGGQDGLSLLGVLKTTAHSGPAHALDYGV